MPASYVLFGDSKPFLPPSWQTVDDRVRGGSSQSYLSALPGNGARFYGNLDIKTLGGAGFASQFSPIDDQDGDKIAVPRDITSSKEGTVWDLSEYDGLQINLAKGDSKVYTFILKDEENDSKRDDGREKAGINWEVDIKAENEGVDVWKPWAEFKAFYRGKEEEDAGKLETSQVRRVGIMMRSYFGSQEGDFDLQLTSISARAANTDNMNPKTRRSDTGKPSCL